MNTNYLVGGKWLGKWNIFNFNIFNHQSFGGRFVFDEAVNVSGLMRTDETNEFCAERQNET